MSAEQKSQNLLSSWKEIAAYLDQGVRTCQRWEKKRGLPVKRVDKTSNSRVYTLKSELDEWLKKGSDGGFKRANILVIKHLKYLYLFPILCVIVSLTFIIPKFSDHQDPTNFKINNSTLIILDKDDKKIWQYDTSIEAMSDEKFYRNRFNIKRRSQGPRLLPLIIFRDIDSDGRQEVLFSIYAQGEIKSGNLFCFNREGVLLWELNPLRNVTFGKDIFTSFSYPDGFDTYDMNHDGQFEIVLIANHTQFFPTRLLLIDNKGKMMGEYWNSGRINDFIAIDLDNDGVKELIIVGINNEYKEGFLAVFDSRLTKGCSPQNDEYYICKEIEPGTHIYYLRFPRTDASIQKYGQEGADDIDELPNKRILVRVGQGVYFEFDFDLKIQSIRFATEFDKLHRDLSREGKVHSVINEEYHRNLAKNILYYDGEEWVSQPTKSAYGRNLKN